MNKKISILSLFFILMLSFTSNLNALNYSVNRNFLSYNLIYASGKIRRGDLYKLKRAYSRLSRNRQTIVVFNSAGGELNEGLRIGEFLRSHRIGSAVRNNGICASSCALAFLGGRDKHNRKFMVLPDNAKLGFHSFYYRNRSYVKLSTIQKDLANVLNYANYVGAPTSLIAEMFNTKSSSMHWVTSYDKRLLKLRRGLPRVNFSTAKADKGRYYKRNVSKKEYSRYTSSNYGITQTKYIKSYISKINSVITANRGVIFNNEVALNDSSYQSWLSSSLKYVFLRKIKLISRNKVEAEVVYALKNGKRICSRNTYNLVQRSNGWKIITKQHKACNYKSKKILKRIASYLP